MHESPAEGDGDRLGAVADLEFREDVFHVGFHSLLGDAQGVGDFLVGLAESQEMD